MIFPYGEVKVPGKWTKTRYNTVSHQYFFKGPDSVTLAIDLNKWNQYEFYNETVTLDNFVKTFFEWEASYMREQTGGEIKVLKEDKEKNFIIWSIKKQPDIDSYFLFGLKAKTSFNLYVTSAKWSEETKIELLEKVYGN